MFITKNKKDYERHLRSKKHQDSSLCKIPVIEHMDTNKKDTYIDNDGVPMCPNCKKVYKSRTSIYTHMKTCGVVAAPAPAMTETRQIASPETFTPEQIQYILIENRILKELLKNVIQCINPPILAGPKWMFERFLTENISFENGKKYDDICFGTFLIPSNPGFQSGGAEEVPILPPKIGHFFGHL